MTREERDYAKSRIEYLLKICRFDERDKEALEIAIQALSQEPTMQERIEKEYLIESIREDLKKLQAENDELRKQIEPCEDAISREAILNKIKEVCFSKKWTQFRIDNGSNGQRDFIIDYIEQLPPVTPQTECLKAQAKKQAIPMSCDDCCYEPNSPFCEMYRKNICEKKEEPKLGKWILMRTSPTKLYGEHIREYQCSECYRGIRCTESQLFNYPYCHCGAKMESEGKG